MRNVLITGINGFVGQNCFRYFSKDCNVYGIDMFGSPTGNVVISPVSVESIKQFNVEFDLIIHLAGSGSVGAVQKDPSGEKKKSVDSLIEILNYMRDYNQNARLIFSSSASVYGDDYKRPIKEEDKKNPVSKYGEYKLEAEEICKKYSDRYGLDIKVIRFFSLYGIGCRKQLLWDVLTRIKNSNSDILQCFGTGKEARDFVNISDAVKFINIVSGLNKGFDIFNCAKGCKITVSEIINILIEEYGKEINPVFDMISRTGNPVVLIADISKAVEIGFQPQIDLKKGIKDYVKWFKTL